MQSCVGFQAPAKLRATHVCNPQHLYHGTYPYCGPTFEVESEDVVLYSILYNYVPFSPPIFPPVMTRASPRPCEDTVHGVLRSFLVGPTSRSPECLNPRSVNKISTILMRSRVPGIIAYTSGIHTPKILISLVARLQVRHVS